MTEKPLKLYQMWSVWAATLLGVLTALEPFWPQLRELLPPAWQAPAAALVIILRAIKQVPPKPPSAGLGAALLVIGCSGSPPPAPKYTPEEMLCIADAERVKMETFELCEPHCTDAQIDTVMDARKAAGNRCYVLGGRK